MQRWQPREGAVELLHQRTRDAKHFRNPDGTCTAVFSRGLHYEKDGSWHEANRDFRMDGDDFVADELPFAVRLSGANLTVTDKVTGKGIRYLVPAANVVMGNRVRFKWAGHDFSYHISSSGIKLEGTIPARRGNAHYQFTYTLVGGAADLVPDADGNLAGEGFTVQKPKAIGADGRVYPCGEWVMTGNRIAFSFDDSAMPDEVFPYTLDPSTTFNLAVSADDAYQGGSGATYPPAVSYTDAASDTFYIGRSLVGGTTYSIATGTCRFNTASLEDTATVTGATFEHVCADSQTLDSRDFVVEWYAASNFPWDNADYTTTAPASPDGSTPISGKSVGATYQVALANAAANVNKTGYTAVRFHVSGGQPTGANYYYVASFDHATYQEPRLIVDYNTGTGGSPRYVSQTAVLSAPVTAGAHYVATNGNNANPGTFDQPWRTLDYACGQLSAGDTLYVRSGTYAQASTLTISANGTAGSRITIQGYPYDASRPIITGDNGNGVCDALDTPGYKWTAFIAINGNYVTFQHIEVCYSGGMGVVANGAYDTISDCYVHHTWSTAIKANDNSSNCLIEDCIVDYATYRNYNGGVGGLRGNTDDGNWDSGIGIGGAVGGSTPIGVNATVRGCTILHASGEGLLAFHTTGLTIEGCVFYDNWGCGIDFDQVTHSTIDGNLLYYTSDSSWWRGSPARPWTGILLSNENINSYTETTHALTITNNIVVGCGNNLAFWSGAKGAMVDSTIANNTLINPYTGTASISIDAPLAGYAHSNTRIANNVVYQSSGTLISCPTTSGLTFDHNCWAWNPGASFSGTGDVVGNPLLADPNHAITAGAVDPTWYRLTSTSPCINAGATISAVTDDYDKQARVAPYDIGAGEFMSGRTVIQRVALGALNLTRAVVEQVTLGGSMPTRAVAQFVSLSGSLTRSILQAVTVATNYKVRSVVNYAAIVGTGLLRSVVQTARIGGSSSDIFLYATTPSTPLSNINRSLDITPTKIVREHRLASGAVRRDLVATKHNFALSWKFLPSQDDDVEDGGLGVESLESLLATGIYLYLQVPTGAGTNTTYTVFPTPDPIKKTLSLRRESGKCYWDVTVSLVEA